MNIELHTDSRHLSPYAMWAFVALHHKGLDFVLTPVDLEAGAQHQAAHQQRSLTARVPVLVVDGWSLSESSAIIEYLDDAWPERPLLPTDLRQRARARQLQAWLRSDLGALRAERSTEVVFLGRRGGSLGAAARAQADKLLRVAGTLLAPGQRALFDAWCIADVELALMLQRLVRGGDALPPHLLAYAEQQWQLPAVQEWLALPRPPAAPADAAAAPALAGIDHVHVFVADRARAEAWYARVLRLAPVPELESWAADGGPLTLADAGHTLHIALFERAAQPCRSTIALRTDGAGFIAWRAHLQAALGAPLEAVDHALSWSLYFNDPDGNPYEITSYEHAAVAAALKAAR